MTIRAGGQLEPRAYRKRWTVRGRTRSECGFTLVEVLVAISLLGAALTILLGGLGMSYRFGRIAKHRAAVETEARVWAEYLRDVEYFPCNGGNNYNAAENAYLHGMLDVYGLPDGPVLMGNDGTGRWLDMGNGRRLDIEEVNTWDGVASTPGWSAITDSDCRETGVQQVTVRVSENSSPTIAAEVVLVKRDQL